MRSTVKVALVLAVTLPMLAYVAGRLAAAPPSPDPLTPVILEKPASSEPPATEPRPPRSSSPDPPDDDRGEPDDDDIRVVNPKPSRVGEDDTDDAPDDGPEDGAAEDDRTDDDSSGGDD
jgi:hypothetical protein